MGARILDGRAIAAAITAEVADETRRLRREWGEAPGIAVVIAAGDPASAQYVRQIGRVFDRAGLRFARHDLDATVGTAEIVALVRQLGADPSIDGIIVQMPLPSGTDIAAVVAAIPPEKDVDGIHPLNAGRLATGAPDALVPATPLGGLEILRRSGIEIAGRHAVVVGRSNVVGKPFALLLLAANATVTVCHSRTPDLAEQTRRADILALATGRVGLVDGSMVKPGATVIDFGTNYVDGKLVGDADFDSVEAVAGAVTPVPGGTGPVTNAILLRNTLEAARRRRART